MNDDICRQCLAILCEAEGGYKTVAERTRVNPDYLWQILRGIKLPSGLTRGVGVMTLRKISANYPRWLGHLQAGHPTDGYGADLDLLTRAIPDKARRIEAYPEAVIAIRAVATRPPST